MVIAKFSPEFFDEMLMSGIPVKDDIELNNFLSEFQKIISESNIKNNLIFKNNECLIYDRDEKHIASVVLHKNKDFDYRLILAAGDAVPEGIDEDSLTESEEEEISELFGNVVYLLLILLTTKGMLNTEILEEMGYSAKVEKKPLDQVFGIQKSYAKNNSNLEEYSVENNFFN